MLQFRRLTMSTVLFTYLLLLTVHWHADSRASGEGKGQPFCLLVDPLEGETALSAAHHAVGARAFAAEAFLRGEVKFHTWRSQ